MNELDQTDHDPSLCQLMSSVNQDLSRVRALCKIPKPKASTDQAPPIVCCDQRAISTGVRRSLAASLVSLNCPQTPQKSKPDMSYPPVKPMCDAYEPTLDPDQYDMSRKSCRPTRVSQPLTGHRRELSGTALREVCPSKAEALVRFNNRYAETENTPDLRHNATKGKRHAFSGSVHSQVLRGSMLV